jgi:hypothetical protein
LSTSVVEKHAIEARATVEVRSCDKRARKADRTVTYNNNKNTIIHSFVFDLVSNHYDTEMILMVTPLH